MVQWVHKLETKEKSMAEKLEPKASLAKGRATKPQVEEVPIAPAPIVSASVCPICGHINLSPTEAICTMCSAPLKITIIN